MSNLLVSWRNVSAVSCCAVSAFFFMRNITTNEFHFRVNRSFLCSNNSHVQNKAKCKIFLVKTRFIYMRIKTHFHINGTSPRFETGAWGNSEMAHFFTASGFPEPHYIGQEANNISTHIHDQLRQQYIMFVKSFFWKGRKEENNAIFRQNSSRVVLLTYTGH